MKTLKFSLFLAIIFACISFMACDPINPPNPDPQDPPVTVADSVVIQVTIIVPTSVVVYDVQINVWNSIFTDGVQMKLFFDHGLVKTVVYKDTQAKALIGKTCDIEAFVREGTYNGTGAMFDRITPGKKAITIQKGLNQASFDFNARQ
jgi:hypothetical protein